MDIKITDVFVDKDAINPTLSISSEIIYNYLLEAPISISGKLNAADGKTIAVLNETQIMERDVVIDVAITGLAEKQLLMHQKNTGKYFSTLSALLTSKAIEHIENCREKNSDKIVHFHMDLIIKAIEVEPSANTIPTKIKIRAYRTSGYFKITQSEWVKKYSPSLGIGNFILLELEIPSKHEVSTDWTELYERLSLRLNEMQDAIRQGDWQRVMDRSRQFYETIKIGDGKAGHKKFEEQLKQLFKNDQHSEEGFQNLMGSIWQFFEYNSKFIHDKNREGKFNPIPIPTKEDAYLAYSFGVGLLNVIGRKTQKMVNP